MNIDYIAEIGSNHCGDLYLALDHITQAKEAGATGVKFQLFRAETLDSRPEVQAQLRPYELPLGWLPSLRDAAHAEGLTFGVTPFAVDLVEPLRGIVDWVKISAYDLTFDDLIVAAAGLNVPVVLSTAMASLEEIRHAVAGISQTVILLYGVAQYPAREDAHRMLQVAHLQGAFPTIRIGLSDHTRDWLMGAVAVAYGLTWIEKHFVTKEARRRGSPDSSTSMPFLEFFHMLEVCEMVRMACITTAGLFAPQSCEMPLYTTCRRSNEKRVRG